MSSESYPRTCGVDIGFGGFAYAVVSIKKDPVRWCYVFNVCSAKNLVLTRPSYLDMREWANFASDVANQLPDEHTAIETQLPIAVHNYAFYLHLTTVLRHDHRHRIRPAVHAANITRYFKFKITGKNKSERYNSKKEAAVKKVEELYNRSRLTFATEELHKEVISSKRRRDLCDAILIAIYDLYRKANLISKEAAWTTKERDFADECSAPAARRKPAVSKRVKRVRKAPSKSSGGMSTPGSAPLKKSRGSSYKTTTANISVVGQQSEQSSQILKDTRKETENKKKMSSVAPRPIVPMPIVVSSMEDAMKLCITGNARLTEKPPVPVRKPRAKTVKKKPVTKAASKKKVTAKKVSASSKLKSAAKKRTKQTPNAKPNVVKKPKAPRKPRVAKNSAASSLDGLSDADLRVHLMKVLCASHNPA